LTGNKTAIRGEAKRVDNLKEGENLQGRKEQALGMLKQFSADTGVCGGEGYVQFCQVMYFDI
jgi:hypothetical protein